MIGGRRDQSRCKFLLGSTWNQEQEPTVENLLLSYIGHHVYYGNTRVVFKNTGGCGPTGRLSRAECLLALLGLLREKDRVDVRENTTGGNGHAREELVELLVVADGQGDVARDDARLLVVAGGVARELKDLRSHVLENGGEVHRGTGANARRVLAELHVAVDTANRELETGLGRARRRLLLRATTATLHHD